MPVEAAAPAYGDFPLSDAIEYAVLPILGDLSPDILARVLPHCRVVAFAEQAVILRTGQQNDHLHFLLSGDASVIFDLADRSEPIPIERGQIFGEISVIDEMPVTANVIAVSPCRVLLMPASIFWSEVMTVPGVARRVMRRQSQMLRDNATVLVRTAQDRLRHAALERELGLARDIQMSMLRHAESWFPGRQDFEISALIRPARMVGGDFYDAFLVDQNRLVLAAGDVAGKGISAALFMVRAMTLLRNPAANWISLRRTLDEANTVLAADNDTAMFLTLFMAELNLATGRVDYVNYGHPAPLIRHASGDAAYQTIAPGVMFGLVEGIQGGSGHFSLAPGSTLVLYSDGVTEAEDATQRQFGPDGLLAAVAAAGTDNPAALIRSVAAAVDHHAGTAEQSDDITLMAVSWYGPAANL